MVHISKSTGLRLGAVGLTLLLIAIGAHAAGSGSVRASGGIELPNGRTITPAGTVVTADDFPAGLALAPNGTLYVAGAGENKNKLGAVSSSSLKGPYGYPQSATPGSLLSLSGGLAISPGGSTLYAAAAGDAQVISFNTTTFQQSPASYALPDGQYAAGVATDTAGRYLFVTEPLDVNQQPYQKGSTLTRFDLSTGSVRSVRVGVHPVPVVTAGDFVAVGNEADGTVTILNGGSLATIATVRVGRHPSNLAFTPSGSDLLVVSSLDDRLDDIATGSWKIRSTLSLSSPAGIGATPDGLAISPDGATAYVPLAEDNAVEVVALRSGSMSSMGLIPTAWWPTAVAFDPSGPALLVAAGKGEDLQPYTQPGLDETEASAFASQGPAGVAINGTLERIPLPGAAQLAADTSQVWQNNGWTAPAAVAQLCGPPAIQHVVWIIRENKTYDEEFGDMPSGGDPTRVEYGRNFTPNSHALADRFGLYTAFYSDEEISDTGHQALAGGVTNDYQERFTLQYYGSHSPVEYDNYDANAAGQGGNGDSIEWGPSDYLIDDALRHGVSFKDYGHAYRNAQDRRGPAADSALESHIVRDFPGYGFDLSVLDQTRAKFWVQDFQKDVAKNSFPALEVVYLPDDHTGNGLPTDEVSDNDLGTGMIVSALSHSPYWGSSAVFVEEDDPQSGIDHIDEHRTIGLLVSPWTKPGLVSNVHHDQDSILRTIELLLHLPALTELDATATPFTEAWAASPDLRPFDPITPSAGTMSAPAKAAAAAYAASLLGPHPNLSQIPPLVQLEVQWMYTHGAAFNAASFSDPVGISSSHDVDQRVGPAPVAVCAAVAPGGARARPATASAAATSVSAAKSASSSAAAGFPSSGAPPRAGAVPNPRPAGSWLLLALVGLACVVVAAATVAGRAKSLSG